MKKTTWFSNKYDEPTPIGSTIIILVIVTILFIGSMIGTSKRYWASGDAHSWNQYQESLKGEVVK